MSSKFTYIDFLMYVIPGSFLVIVGLLSAIILSPNSSTLIKADLFSSIVFLVLSFIFGNFLQVHSHLGPEKRLRKQYWNGFYPSQIMFFLDNNIINEEAREDLLNSCLKKGFLTKDDIGLFSSKDYNPKAINKAQNAFDYMRSYLTDKDKNERVQGAEGYFLFFRGLFVASFWSAIVFTSLTLIYLLRLKFQILNNLFGKTHHFSLGFIIPIVGALICLYFWQTFRYRCRGAAQGFAREVYRTFCGLVITEKVNQK